MPTIIKMDDFDADNPYLATLDRSLGHFISTILLSLAAGEYLPVDQAVQYSQDIKAFNVFNPDLLKQSKVGYMFVDVPTYKQDAFDDFCSMLAEHYADETQLTKEELELKHRIMRNVDKAKAIAKDRRAAATQLEDDE